MNVIWASDSLPEETTKQINKNGDRAGVGESTAGRGCRGEGGGARRRRWGEGQLERRGKGETSTGNA